MLHGFNFSKIFVSTLIFTYWNASNSKILQYQGPISQVCGAHPSILIVTWLVPYRAIKRKSHKRLEHNQGWEKPIKKKTIHPFFGLFNSERFCFFKNKRVLIRFLKKTKTPSELFYCIMQYHHFQKYTIITCYTYYSIQIWG